MAPAALHFPAELLLKAQGVRLIDETPRHGVHGLVAFIHPKATNGMMIELLQREHHA